MNKNKNSSCVSCFMISLIILLIMLFIPIWYVYQNLQYTNPSEIVIYVEEGEGTEEIAANLLSEKAIKSAFFFQAYAFYTNEFQLLQPGTYNIPANSNISDIVGILTYREQVSEVTLTFPEGSTTSEIVANLASNTTVTENELYDELKSSNVVDGLPFENKQDNVEGYLFPDTYTFNTDTTAKEIISKFVTNFNNKWPETSTNKTQLDDYDILILASIIEKEAANNDERRLISGILHDRLKYVIHLGVNATLNYVLDSPKAFLEAEDLKIESEYNTYTNLGLPPTPICNPGLDSINAALDPEYSDYVYYMHTPDGKIIYSITLDEHNQNIYKHY